MIRTYRKYHIRYVNDFAIRNTSDDDFGIIHRHSTNLSFFAAKFYIPANEIWIGAPYKNETDFLLAVEFFAEDNDLSPTLDYATERKMKKEKLCETRTPPPFIRRSENREIYVIDYIDGSIVRKFFDPEFILGGHDVLYDYIPQNHIWIDTAMNEKEIPYMLEHECIERELMAQGKSYDIAHEYATTRDKESRRKNGVGFYPGDANYPWHGLSNEEVRKRYYIK